MALLTIFQQLIHWVKLVYTADICEDSYLNILPRNADIMSVSFQNWRID